MITPRSSVLCLVALVGGYLSGRPLPVAGQPFMTLEARPHDDNDDIGAAFGNPTDEVKLNDQDKAAFDVLSDDTYTDIANVTSNAGDDDSAVSTPPEASTSSRSRSIPAPPTSTPTLSPSVVPTHSPTKNRKPSAASTKR